jgi:hypothetical protein
LTSGFGCEIYTATETKGVIMALTPAEKSKRWRERQREEREAAAREVQSKLQQDYTTPFAKYFNDQGEADSFSLYLELAGIEPPDFSDDKGPEAHALPDSIAGVEDPFNGAKKGIGRAEVMIGCLIDAAQSLAQLVNGYKKAEIKARIAEMEASDMTDAATRKRALAEIVRLSKNLDQLEKQVRNTLPQWKVTG